MYENYHNAYKTLCASEQSQMWGRCKTVCQKRHMRASPGVVQTQQKEVTTFA
jgi:hypothetical protein